MRWFSSCVCRVCLTFLPNIRKIKNNAWVRAYVRVFPYINKNEYYLCVIVNICAFVECERVFWSTFLSLLVLPTYITVCYIARGFSLSKIT